MGNQARPEKGQVVVRIGQNCYEEKKYIFEILLTTILDLECRWERAGNEKGYSELQFETGFTIRFLDAFFTSPDLNKLLVEENLPKGLIKCQHAEYPERELLALYGSQEILEGDGWIEVRPDLVASAFFLLTRWEESILPDRDSWGRFPDTLRATRRLGIEQRPLVNEYAFWIHTLANKAGVGLPPIPDRFELIPSHDMDRLFFRPLGRMIKDCLKHKLYKRFVIWFLYRVFLVDQVRTIRGIIELSHLYGLRSRFYWMAGGGFPYDDFYALSENKVSQILALINDAGMINGLHPSFDTKADPKLWAAEKESLEDVCGMVVREGRQHFLKFDLPETAKIWEDNAMLVDSSLGFSRGIGFRCGTGSEYPLYDIKARRRMGLVERPLLVMDAAIRKGRERSGDIARALEIKVLCRKYRMPCTILFHNHKLDPLPWNGMASIYKKLILN